MIIAPKIGMLLYVMTWIFNELALKPLSAEDGPARIETVAIGIMPGEDHDASSVAFRGIIKTTIHVYANRNNQAAISNDGSKNQPSTGSGVSAETTVVIYSQVSSVRIRKDAENKVKVIALETLNPAWPCAVFTIAGDNNIVASSMSRAVSVDVDKLLINGIVELSEDVPYSGLSLVASELPSDINGLDQYYMSLLRLPK